jgi:hypothetical protein
MQCKPASERINPHPGLPSFQKRKWRKGTLVYETRVRYYCQAFACFIYFIYINILIWYNLNYETDSNTIFPITFSWNLGFGGNSPGCFVPTRIRGVIHSDNCEFSNLNTNTDTILNHPG